MEVIQENLLEEDIEEDVEKMSPMTKKKYLRAQR